MDDTRDTRDTMMILDRLMPPRSPTAAKYRRVVDGLELPRTPTTNHPDSPHLPSTESADDSARQGVYRRLFGSAVADASGFLGGADGQPSRNDARVGPLFVAPARRAGDAVRRPLMTAPVRILDAPGLEDDFYLNLLDWETRGNRVTVLLGGTEVYFWQAGSVASASGASAPGTSTALGRMKELDVERGCVIKWSTSTSNSGTEPAGEPLLAIGTRSGAVEVWNVERARRIHCWRGHSSMRCGVLSWWGASGLSSGGRDHRILHYDLRTPRGIIESSGHVHTQEVCGLRWDHHGTHMEGGRLTEYVGSGLLASGGNDNQLLVWDRRRLATPLLQLNQHTAAVKALDWSPHQPGLLASGGGTADRTIRFWNTRLSAVASGVEGIGGVPLGGGGTEAVFRPIQATSQVCTLAWSPLAPGEILSTHGFSEHNLVLWSYPSGRRLGTLDGHSHRVLFQAVSADGATVVTGSGDETLRFWSVFRRRNVSSRGSTGKPASMTRRDEENARSMFQSSR